ncbi:uncharacterized protein LOC116263377 isoform X2 [Nymphaea colorata]|uniref:uncharacterized protein LOC116263377 isoform X2 n=1 Tax=Nymphaea colorata TaxID=210225 RepID=UPI00214E6EC2|nr:uncharacterized protein LOC116263377 isoform X2 [Nymphaea colorata]
MMELRKGRQLKRKPLSDTTNCQTTTPPPAPPLSCVAASTGITATTSKKRGLVSGGKPQFESSIVASGSSGHRSKDEERQKENQSPAFSSSSFASPGILASEVSYSEQVYKRRCVDLQRLSVMDSLSCPPGVKDGDNQLRSNKEGQCEPGSSMMESSTACMMMQRHYGKAASHDRQSRMCRSALPMVKQKNYGKAASNENRQSRMCRSVLSMVKQKVVNVFEIFW